MPDLVSITPEPLFYGHSAKAKEDLNAEEFLDRQIANLAKPPAIVDEQQKIAATTANFRSQARDWWLYQLPGEEEDADLVTIKRDWEAFVKVFKLEYFRFSEHKTLNASINWMSFKQHNGESTYLFSVRVSNAAFQYSDLNTVPADRTAAATIAAIPAGNAPGQTDARQALNGLNDAAKAYLAGVRHKENLASRKRERHLNCRRMIIQTILTGMSENRLRHIVTKCAEEDDSIKDLHIKIRRGEEFLKQGKGQNLTQEKKNTGQGGNKNNNNRNLHAIEADQSDANVDAVSNNKKGGKGKGKGKGKFTAPDPSKYCKFCHRRGHEIEECRTMAKSSAEHKERRQQDVAATTSKSQDILAADAINHSFMAGNEELM